MAYATGNALMGTTGVSDYDPQRFKRDQNAFQFGNDTFGQQGQGLGALMYNAASGLGPSRSNMQMNQGLAQAGGQMYSNPSLNPALAARLYSNTAGNIAGQGGMARAQEMQGSQSAMAQYLMQQLQQRGAGQQLDANTIQQLNALKMQQDLANAQGMTKGGLLGAAISGGAAMGGAMMGGGAGSMGSQIGSSLFG